jgi:outer membrane lipoprotein carrier protein
MKKTVSILIAILFVGFGFAQDEDKAKEILDKASAKMKGYSTLTIKFGLTIKTVDSDDPIKQNGTIQIKDGKYKLDMDDQEVYNDGKTITTFLEEDNECYTSEVDEADEDFISPEDLLTIWEDGYKFKYGGDTEYAKEKCDVIFLYPTNPKLSKFHTIKLLINQETNRVVWIHLKGKDGSKMTYKLLDLQRDLEMDDSTFEFNPAEHPGVECYDE